MHVQSGRDHREHGAFLGAVLAVLTCAVVFGGATHGDSLSTAVVRLASLPLLCVSIWRLASRRGPPPSPWAIGLLGLIVLVPLIQLAPLPPDLWSRLPGRTSLTADYLSAGIAPPWLPLSLAPYETGDAVLGLAPPAAMFLAALTLDAQARRRLLLTIPLFALVAVALGMLQTAGGEGSPLRFYAETNPDSGVGFFANRNHQAALLVVAVAVAPLWMAVPRDEARGPRRFAQFVVFAIEIVLIVGLGVTRSRAGVVLAGPALFGGLLIVAARRRGETFRGSEVALLAAAVVGAGLVGVFASSRLIDRFQTPLDADQRLSAFANIVRAAHAYFPLGSGLGSFDQIYRGYEPIGAVRQLFLNHAHDDFLELWLETGVIGPAIIALFMLWWGWATLRLLRPSRRWRGDGVRATASLIIALLVAHSTVDYPLRTAALAVIFALACGVLTAGSDQPVRRDEGSLSPGFRYKRRP